jgi:hypothetical protein
MDGYLTCDDIEILQLSRTSVWVARTLNHTIVLSLFFIHRLPARIFVELTCWHPFSEIPNKRRVTLNCLKGWVFFLPNAFALCCTYA